MGEDLREYLIVYAVGFAVGAGMFAGYPALAVAKRYPRWLVKMVSLGAWLVLLLFLACLMAPQLAGAAFSPDRDVPRIVLALVVYGAVRWAHKLGSMSNRPSSRRSQGETGNAP